MSTAPIYEIDPTAFWRDPYPDLEAMRRKAPIAFVPQLRAMLLTRRDDIFRHEKRVDVFSSVQPNGLMTKLMGQNLMRKDGDAHLRERAAIGPAVSLKTVRRVWKDRFTALTDEMIAEIGPRGHACMIKDIAMRISGEALKIITGLEQVSWRELDRVSQGMIDGCANYAGDPDVAARCRDCTDAIDRYIDEMAVLRRDDPDCSLLSVQMQAGLSREQIHANIKLAISGGQNEPRDAIAGVTWALLTHPDQLAMIENGEATWLAAFLEYARWIAPVGMSPRRVARRDTIDGVTLEPDDMVFLMFNSGNRDEAHFARPDAFDITQDASAAVTFGAGPHFCAGMVASRCLIADVALPMIFERLPGLRLAGPTEFGGWAFRGPTAMPVAWDAVDRRAA
ncbi:MAG: cytochrome P450 [Pseudomonadota bacterium]